MVAVVGSSTAVPFPPPLSLSLSLSLSRARANQNRSHAETGLPRPSVRPSVSPLPPSARWKNVARAHIHTHIHTRARVAHSQASAARRVYRRAESFYGEIFSLAKRSRVAARPRAEVADLRFVMRVTCAILSDCGDDDSHATLRRQLTPAREKPRNAVPRVEGRFDPSRASLNVKSRRRKLASRKLPPVHGQPFAFAAGIFTPLGQVNHLASRPHRSIIASDNDDNWNAKRERGCERCLKQRLLQHHADIRISACLAWIAMIQVMTPLSRVPSSRERRDPAMGNRFAARIANRCARIARSL